jgi:hypothetical protein
MRTIQLLKMTTLVQSILVGGCIVASGCEGNLGEQLRSQDPQVMAGQSGRITNIIEAGGAVVSQINASDSMAWVYVQLSSGKEVMPQDPQNSTDWDLALQRFQIKVNGGISGKGAVEVALVTGTAFPALATAPKSGYVTDQQDSADEDSDPDYAFVQKGTWYNYNAMTHLLTPKDQVYVVRATTGAHYKLQMSGYYDQAGSSGYPAFRWQLLTAQ